MKFLGEKVTFPESCTVTASPVSCSCVFFTRFCFELGLGVNTKVVDKDVSVGLTSKLFLELKLSSNYYT